MSKYPKGKLNNDDEGELEIALTRKENVIIISFGKNISWIGFNKTLAIEFANAILEKAEEIQIN
jgi:hypothetical protein